MRLRQGPAGFSARHTVATLRGIKRAAGADEVPPRDRVVQLQQARRRDLKDTFTMSNRVGDSNMEETNIRKPI